MAKKDQVTCMTPVGIVSYPFLHTPDVDKQSGKERYKVDILIPKATWKTDSAAKDLQKEVLKAGRELLKDSEATFEDFENPFQDMDDIDDCHERLKGHIRVRAKSQFRPTLSGPDKENLTEEQLKALKGGDYGRIVVNVYPWTYLKKKGVSLGLTLFQFARPGEALGQGNKAALQMIDEIEVTVDDIETEEEESVSARSNGKASKAKRGRPKKSADDELEDEEADFQFS